MANMTVKQIDERISRLKELRREAQVRERQEDIEARRVAEASVGALVMSLADAPWRSLDPKAVAKAVSGLAPEVASARFADGRELDPAHARAAWRRVAPGKPAKKKRKAAAPEKGAGEEAQAEGKGREMGP